MFKFLINISLISILFNGCSTYKEVNYNGKKENKKKCNFLPKKNKPYWIDKSHLISNKLYYGIGVETFKIDIKEQIEGADKNAVKDLSFQIFSLINVEEEDNTNYKRKNFEELYTSSSKSKINIKSNVLISDYIIKDRWLDQENCILWSLAIVEKNKIKQLQEKINEQINLINIINNNVMYSKNKNKKYNTRIYYIKKAISMFNKVDYNILKLINIQWLNTSLESYHQSILKIENDLIVEKNDILRKIYIGMDEDELLKIIKPEKNSWIQSYGNYERIDSIKYENKYIILENFRVKCVIHQNGFKYELSDDGYNRTLNKSCQWYLNNQSKYVLKY